MCVCVCVILDRTTLENLIRHSCVKKKKIERKKERKKARQACNCASVTKLDLGQWMWVWV